MVKALKKDSHQAIAHIVLGRTLVKSGQIDAGLSHLEQAALLQPENLGLSENASRL